MVPFSSQLGSPSPSADSQPPRSADSPPARRTQTVSFEVMPPRRPERVVGFWRTIDELRPARPDFISVTYGAAGKDRFSARDIVTRLCRDTPVSPIAHLTCVNTSVSTVEAVIEDYLDADVRTFLALRGLSLIHI